MSDQKRFLTEIVYNTNNIPTLEERSFSFPRPTDRIYDKRVAALEACGIPQPTMTNQPSISVTGQSSNTNNSNNGGNTP